MNGGLCLWFTGLSGAGKTTLCGALEPELRHLGHSVRVLDGDEVRRAVSPELGFSKADRDENIARIATLAREMVAQGSTVLVAAISPYLEARMKARRTIERAGIFLEIYVDAPLELCIRRDPKGLYASALAGELLNFTGVDDPYEAPTAPDLRCNTARENVDGCTKKVLAAVLTAIDASWAERSKSDRLPTPAASL